MKLSLTILLVIMAIYGCDSDKLSGDAGNILPSKMFEYSDNIEPRWVSFENITGSKGMGGMENNGANSTSETEGRFNTCHYT